LIGSAWNEKLMRESKQASAQSDYRKTAHSSKSEAKSDQGAPYLHSPRTAALVISAGCVALFQRTKSCAGGSASKGATHPTCLEATNTDHRNNA